MNLTDTVKALEAKDVTVALNLGAHEYCTIDSNCPLAVELRRLMLDAGVTLVELLEGYTAVTAPDPVMSYDFPEMSAKVSILIAGKTIEFELDDVVSEGMKAAIDERFRAVDARMMSVRQLGNSLYSTYLQAIRRAGETNTLPQLEFSRTDLMQVGCLISGEGDTYIFLFPREYKPQYLVSNGVRYKMADEDIESVKRDIFLEFRIRDNRFLSASIYKATGGKLEHYHGTDRSDCWGHVTIPRSWDRRLPSLKRLADLIMNSLVTINLDSLMMRDPADMPHIDRLKDRSTELGIEGEIEVREGGTTGRWVAPNTGETPRAGWGARGGATEGGGRQPDRTEQEYIRRWGVPTDGEAAALAGDRDVCAICGRGYEHHNGYNCPAGTQEEERMRRFGTTEPPIDMEQTCMLCGIRAGGHHDGGRICPQEWGDGVR